MPAAPPPPLITAFALLAQPSPTDIRRAEGLYARSTTSAGEAAMTCYVLADGHLDACSAVDAASKPNYASAIVTLQDKYRLDPSRSPPRQVEVDVAFPKLADRPAILVAKPSAANVVGMTPPGVTAAIQIACEVTIVGELSGCEVAEPLPAEPRLTAAVKSLAARYRFKPAVLADRPVASYYATTIGFSPRLITQPRWERIPSGNDVSDSYPPVALRSGLSGRATIRCDVVHDGTLKACVVVEERPAGVNFGAAALALTPKFKMRPQTVRGEPVDGGVVTIPINFINGQSPVGSYGSFKVLPWLPWTRAPTVEDVLAAYPERARSRGVTGRASLLCHIQPGGRLAACETALESPLDHGFGEAAQKLVAKFQADVTTLKPSTLAGLRVSLLIDFSERSRGTEVRYIRQPQWLRSADGADLAGAFPSKAAAAGVLAGGAVVDCTIASTGFLTACRAEKEDPASLGFGEAGAAIAKLMQANLWTTDGESAVGEKIRLPVRFIDHEAAPPSPASAGAVDARSGMSKR